MLLGGVRSLARIHQLHPQCLRSTIRAAHLDRVPALHSLISSLKNDPNAFYSLAGTRSSAHTFATKPAGQPASRPKAHTGRTPAKRKPATKAATSTSKAAAGTKKKAAKPKKKPAKKAVKSKAKAKAKPKPKVLTDEQKKAKADKQKREHIKKLKKIALTPPNPGRGNAWMVFSGEKAKSSSLAETGAQMKEKSRAWKQITPEQREHYNHIANLNKQKYDRAYSDFITSKTPLQIYEANIARRRLRREYKIRGYQNQLHDERQVKGRSSPLIFFAADRQRTNDYAGMDGPTRLKLLSREWKALSPAEKKPYEDKAAQDTERYHQERQTVYGKARPTAKTKKTS